MTTTIPEPQIIDHDAAHYTDVGNAKRFVQLHGRNVRYVPAWKSWMVWDKKRWVQKSPEQMTPYVEEMTKQMRIGAAALSINEGDKLLKFATASESYNRMMACIKLAQNHEGVSMFPEDFDRGKFLFNCNNGTVNLLTGDLQEFKREDYITKISPIEYHPEVQSPLWEAFVSRIMSNDPEMIRYLQKLTGHALTGDVSNQSFYIFWGEGMNGKGTFIETIKYILNEYARKTAIASLISKKQKTTVTNDIARLKGARFVYASEPDFGDKLSESLIKDLTGKDTINARFLFKEDMEFIPEFKLIIATNHKPGIKGTDKGIWRRVKLVPFIVTIPEAERDEHLVEKLQEEAVGILTWLIEGSKLWATEGLNEPEKVREATKQFRDDMDSLAEFLELCCVPDPAGYVPNTYIYPLYIKWCESTQTFRMSEKAFTGAMEERGYPTRKVKGVRSKINIKLTGYLSHLVSQIESGEQPVDIFDTLDMRNLYLTLPGVPCACENNASNPPNVSMDSVITTNSISVQSVQSVNNIINNTIIIDTIKNKLKERFDKLNKPPTIKDLSKEKEGTRFYINNEIDNIVGENLSDDEIYKIEQTIDTMISDACKARGWE